MTKVSIVRICNKPFVHVLALICVVFLIYSNTLDSPFLFDDSGNIVDNPAIKELHYFTAVSRLEDVGITSSLKSLLKTRYIGYLTFALNYAVHGFDVRGYHLVNIAIHAANSLLVYWLMSLILGAPELSRIGANDPALSDESRNLIPIVTALLFAVHPIQTQAVTYIVQRFASLATLFYLLALVMYVQFRLTETSWRKGCFLYAAALISALLALKTKEFTFTLPFVMILFEFMFFTGTIRKRTLYLAPFFLAILIIPLSLAGTWHTLPEISGIHDGVLKASGTHEGTSRGNYLITQFRVIVTYIRLLFLPVNQNLDYDYPVYTSFYHPEVVLSFVFLLAVFILGAHLHRRSRSTEAANSPLLRLAAFGIFWFFATLAAESSIVPIADVIFEHRVYLPSVGAFMTVVSLLFLLRQTLHNRWPGFDRAFFSMLAIMLLMPAVAAYARNSVWKTSVTIWEDTARKSPNKGRAWANLGSSYCETQQDGKAYTTLMKAVQLAPYDPYAWNNLGVLLYKLGRDKDAEVALGEALRLLFSLSPAWRNLGIVQERLGDVGGAIESYRYAITLNASDVEARVRLQSILNRRKNGNNP